MHGGDVRTGRPAGDRFFEQRKVGGVSARRYFDVARLRVLDPAGNTELPRTLADEPPESNSLHPTGNSQVDDRHVRMG